MTNKKKSTLKKDVQEKNNVVPGNRSFVRRRVQKKFNMPTLTEQSHAAGCDLKLIMQRYTQTGQLPQGNSRGIPEYMDCPDQEQDFQAMQNTLANARSQFELLPQNVKDQFKDANDFMSYLISQENAEEVPEATSGEKSPPEDTEALAEGAEGTSEASPDV